MAFLARIFSYIIQWLLQTFVTTAIEWAKKKRVEHTENKEVDTDVAEIEKVRAEILVYRSHNQPVPLVLENRFRELMRKFNSTL